MGIRLGVQYLIEGLQPDRKSMFAVEFHFDSISETRRVSVVKPLSRYAACVLKVLVRVHATGDKGSRKIL